MLTFFKIKAWLIIQIHIDIVKQEIQRGLAVLLTSNPRVRLNFEMLAHAD